MTSAWKNPPKTGGALHYISIRSNKDCSGNITDCCASYYQSKAHISTGPHPLNQKNYDDANYNFNSHSLINDGNVGERTIFGKLNVLVVPTVKIDGTYRFGGVGYVHAEGTSPGYFYLTM